MPACLLKYPWVKLPRNRIPSGKGLMGHWMKLASRVAFRNGSAKYCGYTNEVSSGQWAGGIVGLKSILGVKDRNKSLSIIRFLTELGYMEYHLNPKTKKLEYKVNDWIVDCSGEPYADGAVYATDGYGFLCVPRDITERLAQSNRVFDEMDAWLDLWCHTAWKDKSNAFTFLAPAIQFSRTSPILTLESLGARWHWEKTKVWRFFHKFAADFHLQKLPGSYGCLVFNTGYPGAEELTAELPSKIKRILDEIRILGAKTHKLGSDHDHLNRLITWYSKKITVDLADPTDEENSENRVALLPLYIRAYFSHDCCNYLYCYRNIYSCTPKKPEDHFIRGPCFTMIPFCEKEAET